MNEIVASTDINRTKSVFYFNNFYLMNFEIKQSFWYFQVNKFPIKVELHFVVVIVVVIKN